MVEILASNQAMRVRFPPPVSMPEACTQTVDDLASVAQRTEHQPSKLDVVGSNPTARIDSLFLSMPPKDPEQRRAYQRSYYQQNAARADRLKEERGNACERCGYNDEPRILQFHHRESSKSNMSPSRMWTRAEHVIREEAKKCDLLCPNCHRLIHLRA